MSISKSKNQHSQKIEFLGSTANTLEMTEKKLTKTKSQYQGVFLQPHTTILQLAKLIMLLLFSYITKFSQRI